MYNWRAVVHNVMDPRMVRDATNYFYWVKNVLLASSEECVPFGLLVN